MTHKLVALFIAVFAVSTMSSDVGYTCEKHWELLGHHCYLDVFNQPWDVLAAPQSFLSALEVCKTYGGTLPSFVNPHVLRLLKDAPSDVWMGQIWRSTKLLKSGVSNFRMKEAICTEQNCWIDGTPVDRGLMTKFENTPWKIAGKSELCVVMMVPSGKWYLENCDANHIFWCQIPAKIAVKTPTKTTVTQKPAKPFVEEIPRVITPRKAEKNQNTLPRPCNGHGKMMCICDQGFIGENCEQSMNNTIMVKRCYLFKPLGIRSDNPGFGGCKESEICVPDDLDCLEARDCDDPVGWCLPRRHKGFRPTMRPNRLI